MKKASFFPMLLEGFLKELPIEIPSLETLAQLLREKRMKEKLCDTAFYNYVNQQILNSVKEILKKTASDIAQNKLEKMYDFQRLSGTKETEMLIFELLVVHFGKSIPNEKLLEIIHNDSGQYSEKYISFARTAFTMK